MCVTRPIHVSAGITRNSWYGLMKPVEHHHNKSSANDSGIDSAIEVSVCVVNGDNNIFGGGVFTGQVTLQLCILTYPITCNSHMIGNLITTRCLQYFHYQFNLYIVTYIVHTV